MQYRTLVFALLTLLTVACGGGERGGSDAEPEDATIPDAVLRMEVGPTGPCEGSMAPGGQCSTNTECDDGLRCNGIDLCEGEFGCVCDPENPPVVCDDFKLCTIDSCQEPAGTCQHEPDDSRCADDGNECRTGICEPSRSEDHTGCVYEPVPNGIPCDEGNGACFDGFCCHGCWDGMNCQAGTTASACGVVGSRCDTCDDGDACTSDACEENVCVSTPMVCADTGSDCSFAECRSDEGGCVTVNLPDATPCEGGSGFCLDGSCCHGCYEGAICREPGTETTACGELGAMCESCDDSDACTIDSCESGRCRNVSNDCDDMNECTSDGCNRLSGCTHRSEPDGTACAMGSGQCYSGACCEGCWDGAACQPGDVFSACGAGGTACEDCDDANPCTIDSCTAAGCEHIYIGDGAACGAGFCFGGECCMGCREGGVCRPGTTRTACGSGGLEECRRCECPSDDCADGMSCPPPRYRVTSMATGYGLGCAITNPSELYCWGDGTSGAIGHGVLSSSPSPTLVSGGHSDWTSVATGRTHSCGIRTSGRDRTAWCWGERGTNGRLGDGVLSGVAATRPVAVGGGLTRWIDIGVGTQHACGLTSTEQIFCWGEGSQGRIGNGTTTDRALPTSVSSGLAETWTTLAVGPEHACGIRRVCYPPASPTTCSDYQQLWCWGVGADGRLGYGGTADRLVPTLVGGPTDNQWTEVSPGTQHTCAVNSAGSLLCWGENSDGQLGRGVVGLDQLTPRSVTGGGMAWVHVAAGGQHTCGIRLDRTLWCWGDGSNGALGVESPSATGAVPTPTQVGRDADWAEVSAGESHTCGLKMDGTLYCWGSNRQGQLGTGLPMVNSRTPVRVCFFAVP